MKKFLILVSAIILPIMASAQAQITTKKYKINDFTQKITKIVTTGNIFYDACLKDEIVAGWRVSPYEFCTLEEFNRLKTNDEYYFLIITKGQFRKETEPGLQFISLVKGGEKAEKGIDNMLEIVSIPFASAEEPSGRELVFLPALLDIIQGYALDSMDKDLNAYAGLANYTIDLYQTKDKNLIFAEEDLSDEVSDEKLQICIERGMNIVDADDADEYISNSVENTLVSYVVAPTNPVNGSFCYKMLIDSQTHQLFYFRKHRINKKLTPGFLNEDILRITDVRY